MPYLQVDGVVVASISDDLAHALLEQAQAHGPGEQKLEDQPVNLAHDSGKPRWIASEVSLGLTFFKDGPHTKQL